MSHPMTAVSLLVTALLAAAPVAADIYKYADVEGHITLTDKPMKAGYRLLRRFRMQTAKPRARTVDLARYRRNKERFSPLIEKVAQRARLRPELLHAVVRAESAYDPEAESGAGAVGLMQLMPDTARRYGVADRRDPDANLAGGARYLRDLLQMFGNDLQLALAAYNAGENAVIKSGNNIPPFAETRDYVTKVMRFYQEKPGTETN